MAAQHRFAGQHALDAGAQADAGEFTRGARDARVHRTHGQRRVGLARSGLWPGLGGTVRHAPAKALHQGHQLGQVGQALGRAARGLPLARAQRAAQRVPAQVRAVGQLAQPLKLGLETPGLRLPRSGEIRCRLRDRVSALQPRLQRGQAIEVP